VSDEQEVVPVSIFKRSFKDIAGELTCGVIGRFAFKARTKNDLA
jgi:hypothetical protein